MTIAIGAHFDGGVIICADTKVTATDGATTYEQKVNLAANPLPHPTETIMGMADASEDAYAAKMLAYQIASAVCDAGRKVPFDVAIKSVMEPWYSSYRYVHAPQVQFIIALAEKNLIYTRLLYCEPPSTVAEGGPMAIGKGSRVVEPLLSIFDYGEKSITAKSALLRLAYLIQIAKRDEGSACGGETDAVAVSSVGDFINVSKAELARAEEFGAELDRLMRAGTRFVLGKSREGLKRLHRSIDGLAKEYEKLEFPSVERLCVQVEKKK